MCKSSYWLLYITSRPTIPPHAQNFLFNRIDFSADSGSKEIRTWGVQAGGRYACSNLVVRKCNNLFFYFFCYCMYGLRLRNFAFFKGFFYLLFRSRSLSRLPNSVVFLVKRKEKKRKQSSVYSARARCITSRTCFFVPSSHFHLIVFFLLSTDLVRITTRRVTFTVRHSFSSARFTRLACASRSDFC